MKLNKLGPFAPKWYTEVTPTIITIYSTPLKPYATPVTITCTSCTAILLGLFDPQ